MNQLSYNIAKWNLRDERPKILVQKREQNRLLKIGARECDAITVLNKIMDARSR